MAGLGSLEELQPGSGTTAMTPRTPRSGEWGRCIAMGHQARASARRAVSSMRGDESGSNQAGY